MSDHHPQEQHMAVVLRAVAASTIYSPAFTPLDRQAAFTTLHELKNFDGRMSLAVQWLLQERHVYEINNASNNNIQQFDITMPTKLLALEIIAEFLNKGDYHKSSESDRLQLRRAILEACRLVALASTTTTTTGPDYNKNNNNDGDEVKKQQQEGRILGKKLAAILQAIVVRDFPQRWTTFTADVFKPLSAGGLWCDPPSTTTTTTTAPEQPKLLGVHILLECLKLIAEDCTDSDYNAKISTQRRNDVLIGLNEVATRDFLPLLFQLLQQHYPTLQQCKAALYNMHLFLLQNNRTIHNLTPEEATQYRAQWDWLQTTGQVVADTLLTLSRFCTSMPISWMLAETSNNCKNASPNEVNRPPDFIAAMMHLLRERHSEIQILAAECIDELAIRGKLDYTQWMRFLVELPAAIGEANAQVAQQLEMERVSERARGESFHTSNQITESEALAAQIKFHRTLSKLLSTIVASHVVHITSHKNILEGKGADYASLTHYLALLVEVLHHPSGRICSEQMNLWTMLLRDPQISSSSLLPPYAHQILQCYMNHFIKVRWEEDVENESHPHYKVLEASFDDEEDYDAWQADLRSRSTILFKFTANMTPAVAAKVVNERFKVLLAAHGTGQPLHYLHPSNNQLTQKSDAVILFEAVAQPFENILAGIPPWTMSDQYTPPKDLAKHSSEVETIRKETRAALAEFCQNLVSWNPDYLWLRIRRADLLESLKLYWKYEPSTLLQGIDSLIRYIGSTDEWGNNGTGQDESDMSSETIGLKKKSGVSLVAIAKHVPQHLVPWINEVSHATSNLLASPGLIPTNQTQLFEFLSCVASAVEDPVARAGFIANVLSNPLETIASAAIQPCISSPAALLSALGITQVGENPLMATNADYVREITSGYATMFTALNRLLSVGKRCNEAARKRGAGIGGIIVVSSGGSMTQNFVDEGPISLQDLAVNDPFAPLWPRIVPTLLSLTDSILSIWKPEHQAHLLRNPLQRYALAISDDEAYGARQHGKSSGGVFGTGGTAGSVVSGTDRRDKNLVPRWSGWLTELRNTCFQMFGLLATGRALFAPELRDMYPAIVATMVDKEHLKAMEHRHITQYMKHVLELLLLSCPSSLYSTHLGPIVGPILEHIRSRLEYSWSPFLSGAQEQQSAMPRSTSENTKALHSGGTLQAAELAAKGGEPWFIWYYSHGGLFVGDLDQVTADAAVEKQRVDLGRVVSDVLQSALALKGDWALVLANRAKEEQAAKKNDSSVLYTVPRNQVNNEGVQVNADGTPKSELSASIDARKLLRINGLCHFLFLENEAIAGNLALTIVQCLGYPDAYTVRRITKICHRMLETVSFSPQYTTIIGRDMFNQAVKNVVLEPKWMVGIEWAMINVVRDIYCRLVLGQFLQPGGQGAAIQQPIIPGQEKYEQSKTVNDPLHGGGVLEVPSQLPRQTLSEIPGIGWPTVEQFEAEMKSKLSVKEQKDVIRDLLRVASDNVKDALHLSDGTGAASGLFGRAAEDESLLHVKTKKFSAPPLPEKLVSKKKNKNPSEEYGPLHLFHIE